MKLTDKLENYILFDHGALVVLSFIISIIKVSWTHFLSHCFQIKRYTFENVAMIISHVLKIKASYIF